MEYIKHINHIKKLLGGINNIAISTDDMTYYKIEPEYYQTINVFKQSELKKEITNLLKKYNYTDEEIRKIEVDNIKQYLCQKFP